ncbi:hypothetical protein PENTCL1PPCAC_8603, partial [Pristionchus entomophagus]
NGNGSLSILVLGNSFAERAAPVIRDVFHGHYSVLRIYTGGACRILAGFDAPKYRDTYPTLLEKMRPDITLVISRENYFLTGPALDSDVPEFARASVLQRFDLKRNFSRRLVVDGQNPFCGWGALMMKNGETIQTGLEIARRFQKKTFNMSELYWTRNETAKFHSFETEFLSSMASSNANFTFNKVYDQFCLPDEDVCPFYNPANLHSYYADYVGHLSVEGLNALREGYQRIASRLIRELYLE